jgi:pilus assembly protein CpaB
MRTRLLGGVAALIVAIVGTVLLITYVTGADRRALANTETEDVYVVQKAVTQGASAATLGDAVVKKPIPKVAIPADTVRDLSTLSGKVASAALEPGEELLSSRFVDPSTLVAPGRVSVPAGMQEMTVRLPIERVVGGALAAGDSVGVLLSFPKDDSGPAQTQMTYHKVLVTAVQFSTGAAAADTSSASSTESGGNGGGGLTSASKNTGAMGDYLVTLARPSSDTERIVFAAEFGKVYLTKESASTQDSASDVIDRTKVLR